jgi:hypothetical protein
MEMASASFWAGAVRIVIQAESFGHQQSSKVLLSRHRLPGQRTDIIDEIDKGGPDCRCDRTFGDAEEVSLVLLA